MDTFRRFRLESIASSSSHAKIGASGAYTAEPIVEPDSPLRTDRFPSAPRQLQDKAIEVCYCVISCRIVPVHTRSFARSLELRGVNGISTFGTYSLQIEIPRRESKDRESHSLGLDFSCFPARLRNRSCWPDICPLRCSALQAELRIVRQLRPALHAKHTRPPLNHFV